MELTTEQKCDLLDGLDMLIQLKNSKIKKLQDDGPKLKDFCGVQIDSNSVDIKELQQELYRLNELRDMINSGKNIVAILSKSVINNIKIN